MDNILKKVNLDFEFTTYKVLATSKSDGFVEFVPNSRTIFDVLKKYVELSPLGNLFSQKALLLVFLTCSCSTQYHLRGLSNAEAARLCEHDSLTILLHNLTEY